MNDYLIKKTFNTPAIEFLPSEGVLKIEGRSIPEDPGDFYTSIIERLEEYYKNPNETTRVECRFEYINSGSAKYMLEILRRVKRHYDNGKKCLVNWYYEEEDESILELGQNFQDTLQIPFNLINYS